MKENIKKNRNYNFSSMDKCLKEAKNPIMKFKKMKNCSIKKVLKKNKKLKIQSNNKIKIK